jgi:STE24 endopeptidase
MSAVGFSMVKWAEETGRPVPPKEGSGSRRPESSSGHLSRVKAYNRTKLTVGLLGGILLFAFVLIVVASGLSRSIASLALTASNDKYIAFLIFAAILGFMEIVVSLPLKLYSGFYLEHRYSLSNQAFLRWLWEQTKALLVGIPLIVPILLVFLYSLGEFGNAWWLPVAIVMFIFTTLLVCIAPKLIFPLFYKFTRLQKETLKERINRLCAEAGFHVEGVFSFNMSKNTKKANAGFAGLGKTKRVILGDTLVENFSEDEIETVLAHELGHYRRGHIWKGILISTVVTFVGLFITSRLYVVSLSLGGFGGVDDLAALPLLGLWLGLFGFVMSPIMNLISRKHEYEADEYAITRSGNPLAFIDALKKLAAMNLADSAPHPVVEFLFYSHPSIEKRIRRADSKRVKYATVSA